MPELTLYQPDIPQNVGAAIRLCACLGVKLNIIEPCGFPWHEDKIKRAAMDYAEYVDLQKHLSWEKFIEDKKSQRLVLMTTKTHLSYYDFNFQAGDILIAGRESAGVPDDIHNSVDERITIPISGNVRSLNVINACAMVLGEVKRQISDR